ncbi:MAG: hypothetical protein H6Q90_2945 [Deltaproteobacteria bacterium]|nr:hypothetical protein [Deltaproteobacteria bacterium]
MRRACLVAVASILAKSTAFAAPEPKDPTRSEVTNVDPASPVNGAGLATPDHPTRRSLAVSAAETAGAYGLLYTWVSLAWYVRTTDSETFHLHDEGWFGRTTYAGGSDKLGHGWGNYAMTRGVSQVLQGGGWNRHGSIAVAGGLSLGFFTFSEIKDGYKKEYGFSYGDMISNAIGVGLGMVFELTPALDRRIDLRISYLPSSDYLSRLQQDGPFNTPEDYTGQTFLVAYHLGSIDFVRHRASWARFVDLNLGYQAVNYKPMPVDGGDRTQDLFFGASINLQEMFDSLGHRGAGASVLHFVTEMYQVPYTTLRVGGFRRTTPQ